jgi:cytidyltransferase-like protein
MTQAVISAAFDDLRSGHIRFLQEAARTGDVHVLLWSDRLIRDLSGEEPKFPLEERLYLLRSLRYVSRVTPLDSLSDPGGFPEVEAARPDLWVVSESDDDRRKQSLCKSHGIGYMVMRAHQLSGFPANRETLAKASPSRKKVLVTGCFDWLHSGHVRFFEEVSQLGDLYVVVGHDANIRLLKGEGHPLYPQEERRYMVQAVRYVTQALVSSGHGWMDAEPEVLRLRPDVYAVNEDGDVPEKRAFCEQHGLEYVVLKRAPKDGLPTRESKTLRGF